MLNKIIAFSVNNKLIISLFIISLIGYGSYQVTKLPIDAVPDITNNQVQIITIANSLGATDIERLVTFPIEIANSNIPNLHEIRSFSRFGLSLVTIVFDDDVNINTARQQVSERLLKVQADLPKGVGSISMGPITTGLGEIYQYTIRTKKGYEKKYTSTDLRTIQDWTVRRQLLGVKGVADVSSFGGKLKQYEVAVEPSKLKANGITINDIFYALQKNNQNTGGAYIEKGPTVLYIRSEGLVGNINDINNIFIKNTSNGTPLLIRDVADVKIGFSNRYGALCYNDEGEVAGAIVMMLKGENSSEVIKKVKERITQIKKTLPEGIILEPFLDRTKMVSNAINTVQTNLLEGALIVLLVLILFLGNLRAGLLVASVIPLSMLFAIIMMNIFGVSGNLMSLGALDFGLIIDGAVIIVEALLHSLHNNKKYNSKVSLNSSEMDNEVKYSAGRMMNSAVFGQIIILVVYLPIFFLEGIEGKMFRPMVQTVVFALLGAFILSLTYVPMMSSLFINKSTTNKKSFSDSMMEKVEMLYQRSLSKILMIPKLIILLVVALFSISIVLLSNLGGEFIPALEEGDFAVETRVLTGSNLNTTIEATTKAAHILKSQFPEVIQVVSKIGSGEIPTDPMPMEAADMMIILKDKKEWVSAKTFPELADKMNTAVANIPGIATSFQYPVQMRFNELMTGSKQDVVCKIFGENLDTLTKYAKLISTLSAEVEGTKGIYVEPISGLPQIVIEYNRAQIAEYGLNIEDINKIVNSGLAGEVAGQVFEGEKRFDMIVRLKYNQRKNIQDVRDLLIPTSSGSQIPLHQIAKIQLKESPNQIQREDAKRRIIVGFNIEERDVQTIVEELKTKVEKSVKFPSGYYITYGGAFENLKAAKNRLSITVPISLLLILLLLYFSFGSLKQGLIIYSAIPLSAIGGIYSLYLRSMPFSISAGVGFIALFGVAVLNGIVLIAEFNRLIDEGWTDTKKIVLMGTKIRLRPVLMTAFVASLGFLPMALSNGAGAEVQRPLATVVIGGLLVATFLTLYVLPILFILFENKPKVAKTSIVTVLVLGILLASNNLNAQNLIGSDLKTISLQDAIEIGLKQSLEIKNEKLQTEYYKKVIGTSYSLPNTNIAFDYGSINSAYTDNKISVTQGFKFPTVYSKNKSVLNEEWKAGRMLISVKEHEIKKQITQVYYNLIYLKEKRKLLENVDSSFTNFLTQATLRLNAGETNILEKITAESQLGQIKMQLSKLITDEEVLLLEFRYLLNSNVKYTTLDTNLKLENISIYDTSIVEQHPYIMWLKQNENIYANKLKLEKAKLAPDLFASYFNGTIRGIGADNINYSLVNRFQSVQLGIGIPVFFGSQKAAISASNVNLNIAKNNFLFEKEKLKKELEQSIQLYKMNLQSLNYFEGSALKNASDILKTASIQLQNGQINYLEWTLLVNNAITIKSDYLDVIKSLNDCIIKINSITSK